MFADRAKIIIRSGKGGDGHVSFRRELYVPNGGPDGGDGGRGGDVIFEVDKGLNALTDYRHKRKYAAENGQEGGKKRCHGADGKDIVLKVPEGTVIKEATSGKVIADMSGENQRQIVLKGGRGGKGNMHYATATMQAPKYAQPGQPAQELEVQLELKVIADVGLLGFPNVGKSTFIKMLMGEVEPDSGHFDVGETVRFGYYSQEGLQFDEQMKVIDVVQSIAEYVDLGNGQKLGVSQFLSYFLFTPDKQHNYVYKLSGGEKRRLYLCTVLMRSPNFLVLDEPTNDLDIVTLNVLEEYLRNFKGCVIIVSHDRYFMDKVVDHLLVFRGQADIKDFPGNYTQYREWKTVQDQQEKEAQAALQAKNAAPSPAKSNRIATEQKKKLTFKERKEFEALEAEIPQLEQEKADLEAEMSSGTLSPDDLLAKSQRIAVVMEAIDEKTMRWLELSEWA